MAWPTKEIQAEYMRKYYLKNAEKIKAKSRETALKHPKRTMVNTAKKRAAEAGVPFSLTVNDFEIPDKCPALGIPLVRGDYDAAPSLDRYDPKLGYVVGNVFVISNLANRIKNSATADQVEAVAVWMKKADKNGR